MTSSKARENESSELGVLLRYWRSTRGKSQLDLSSDTGVSQRHISFIENARSVPSRDVLATIADALDIPLRERNAILLAAGYAPMYSDGAWNSPEMHVVTRALERLLRQQDPFPAVVMDRYWNVLMTNDSAPQFFNCFIDMSARKSPRNMLHLMFDPHGMRPFIANWEDAVKGLLERVYRESIGRVVDEGTQELLASLIAYPGVEKEWKVPKVVTGVLPIIPLTFVRDGVELRYFSMVTTVGTPQTIAAQELRMECMFPVEDATEQQHLLLLEASRSRDVRTELRH